MTEYRRGRVAGGTYFFTVTLLHRRSDLLVREVDLLRVAVGRVRQERPFEIDAWVVLPDHIHAVWTLPEGDTDYSTRWRWIKSAFSRGIPVGERRSDSRVAKHERGIWQRRFWEHTIRDERDFRAHVDYVHFNPVKHGMVKHAGDWPYSSFHRCVRMGMYPADWAGESGLGDVGEPW